MATLHHQVWINAPVSKVYAALASADGLGNWWAPHTSTDTREGRVLAHSPGDGHGKVEFLVLTATSDKQIEWQVTSSHPARSPASAWTGTRIRFDISERDNPGPWLGISATVPRMTVLDFRHTGWSEDNAYLGFCNFAWGETLLSLRQWCESP